MNDKVLIWKSGLLSEEEHRQMGPPTQKPRGQNTQRHSGTLTIGGRGPSPYTAAPLISRPPWPLQRMTGREGDTGTVFGLGGGTISSLPVPARQYPLFAQTNRTWAMAVQQSNTTTPAASADV
ncbi:hypothetical protein AB5N19_06400 [Seiridium cardinale]|uniref:Uncharacterized protein n=1 Tax=Seiridium cardinale TaxID=138064 RepID=A0ABR2XBG2_9PEZI